MLADGDVGSFDAVLLINQAAYFPIVLSYSIKQLLKNITVNILLYFGLIDNMAVRVVEFSNGVYKIRKIFA